MSTNLCRLTSKLEALRFSNDQEQRNIAVSSEEIPINLREKKTYEKTMKNLSFLRKKPSWTIILKGMSHFIVSDNYDFYPIA